MPLGERQTGEVTPQQTPAEIEQSFQERIAQLKVTIEANPKNYAALTQLAGLYMLTGEPELAMDIYQRLIVIQPDNIDARLTIASIYFHQQEYTLAAEHIQHVLNEHPDNIQAIYMQAMILADDQKNYQAAVAELEKIVELSPGNTAVHEQVQAQIDEWSANL